MSVSEDQSSTHNYSKTTFMDGNPVNYHEIDLMDVEVDQARAKEPGSGAGKIGDWSLTTKRLASNSSPPMLDSIQLKNAETRVCPEKLP